LGEQGLAKGEWFKVSKKYGFSTRAIHAGEERKKGGTKNVVPPIHMGSTFPRDSIDNPPGGYEYSRTGNPTRTVLEEKLASLENAKYGLVFASGMAAQNVLLDSLLKSGEHIVAFDDLYGGARRLLNEKFAKNFNVKTTYVDASDPGEVEDAIKKNTRLIYLETPTNPLMKLCDIKEISTLGKDKGIYVVVDNTFASPYNQNPLDLGADIVLHSLTKYIGGHSCGVGGALMTSDKDIYERLKYFQNAGGSVSSPFNDWLFTILIKTLPLRMKKHNSNAITIAFYLEENSKVKKVYYPGLRTHPQHNLAKKQMSGFSGMLSFEIDGDFEATKRFVEADGLIPLAESLGGVESLIEHPATMTHAYLSQEERDALGISDSLIRLSVGTEDYLDVMVDLYSRFSKL